MPHIRIITNVPREEFDQHFINDLVKKIAPINGKPEKLFMVSISAGEFISMEEAQAPAAHVSFHSIGKIDEASNAKYSEVFFQALNTKDISSQRIQLTFHDIAKENFAWNNALVSHLFPTPKPAKNAEIENEEENEDQRPARQFSKKPPKQKSSVCTIL